MEGCAGCRIGELHLSIHTPIHRFNALLVADKSDWHMIT